MTGKDPFKRHFQSLCSQYRRSSRSVLFELVLQSYPTTIFYGDREKRTIRTRILILCSCLRDINTKITIINTIIFLSLSLWLSLSSLVLLFSFWLKLIIVYFCQLIDLSKLMKLKHKGDRQSSLEVLGVSPLN